MTRRTTALGVSVAFAAALLAQVTPSTPTAAHARDLTPAGVTSPSRAFARLAADSRGTVRVARGDDGVARVVDVTGARNPGVTRTTSVRDAARAHLARYGALVGVSDPGTTLSGGRVTRSVTGDDVVRFTQSRDGLPVIGSGIAVDLRPDRQLGSVTASVSRASVPPATFPAVAARQEALDVATKSLGRGAAQERLEADPPVRQLYDPAVLGVPRSSDPATLPRGVWSVEVHAGPAFHRLVLIDDRSGAVVHDIDLLERVDRVNRVVCDDENALTTDFACTTNFARTEHSKRSRVKDVNQAFEFAGVVSSFYRQIGGIDLTRLLGVEHDGRRSLAATVRYCDFALPPGPPYCPYPNAFWSTEGQGMFYGQGFTAADDVVGHEMTHGVIAHNADLFYWGQSGAINESLADTMGEIVDHRHPSPGDFPNSWTIGEDLPGGPARSLKDPGRFHQPASMTSKKYAPGGDFDAGGVHTNSGVGNRTFYLISQGGRQGGETVHGIDGPRLTKTATLYLDVIQHLVSGSDYADLAAVLDGSCQALARHHQVGMTKQDCRNVHKATLATRLRTTPRHATQPADAPMTCPQGSGPVRVLFDSEKGTPRSKFDAGSTWVRAPDSNVFPAVPANSTSGHTSWFSLEPQDVTVSSLRMHPVALPTGRPAYLWFQQWRLLESVVNFEGIRNNFDGGTVEVADMTRGESPRPAEGLPWVNGPHGKLDAGFDNPSPGRVVFSGDSRGYLASRLALRRYAGHAISPQFTMNTDNNSTEIGWYLDDIRVYTCGRAPVPRTSPRIIGSATVGSTLTARPGQWSPSPDTTQVQWYADGQRIAGATGTSYQVRDADLGIRLSIKVTATSNGRHGSAFSPATPPVTS